MTHNPPDVTLNKFHRAMLFAAAADTVRLASDRYGAERSKLLGVGMAVWLTSIIAFLSGGYALYVAFDSVTVAFGAAVLWAVIIFNIDRLVVSSMHGAGSFLRRVLHGLPRLLVAVIIGICLAKPVELAVMKKELDAAVDSQRRSGLKIQDVERQIVDLETKMEERRAKYESFDSAAHREWVDGGRAPVKGPRYRSLIEQRDGLGKRIEELKSAIDDKKLELGLLENQQELAESAIGSADGLLGRLRLLHELSAVSYEIRMVDYFLILLFIVLEVTPMLLKILTGGGPYDAFVRHMNQVLESQHLQQARVEVRENELMAEARIRELEQKFGAPIVEEVAEDESGSTVVEVPILAASASHVVSREARSLVPNVEFESIVAADQGVEARSGIVLLEVPAIVPLVQDHTEIALDSRDQPKQSVVEVCTQADVYDLGSGVVLAEPSRLEAVADAPAVSVGNAGSSIEAAAELTHSNDLTETDDVSSRFSPAKVDDSESDPDAGLSVESPEQTTSQCIPATDAIVEARVTTPESTVVGDTAVSVCGAGSSIEASAELSPSNDLTETDDVSNGVSPAKVDDSEFDLDAGSSAEFLEQSTFQCIPTTDTIVEARATTPESTVVGEISPILAPSGISPAFNSPTTENNDLHPLQQLEISGHTVVAELPANAELESTATAPDRNGKTVTEDAAAEISAGASLDATFAIGEGMRQSTEVRSGHLGTLQSPNGKHMGVTDLGNAIYGQLCVAERVD